MTSPATPSGRRGRVLLRSTEPADLPGLAELFRGRFGHPVALEEWEWKYRHLPGEGRSWVAVDGAGRVAAHAGALRLPARLGPGGGSPSGAGAGPVAAPGIWQLTDWAGSAAGGSGLRPPLVALGRRLLADLPGPDDAPWIFGFPSERHLRLGERVFGYRPLPAIMPRAGKLPAGEGGAAAAGASIETSDHCGDWAEAAWAACGSASVRRSAAFLNWRYHARPGRYYRFYRLRAEGQGSPPAEGLAVFAFVGRLARGTELWLPRPPGSAAPADRWEPALRAVARDLAAAGLERWELWPPPAGSGLEPLLDRLGLAPAGEPVPMGCRGRGGETGGPSPADARFHYSMGDFDLA